MRMITIPRLAPAARGSARARRRPSAVRRVDRDRLADDDPDPRKADAGRARAPGPCRRSAPARAARRSSSASLAAPRVHAPPCTVPCGKIATLSPARAALRRARARGGPGGRAGSGSRRARPSARRRAGSARARPWPGSAAAAALTSASSGGSSSDSWFAATTHAPGGTRPDDLDPVQQPGEPVHDRPHALVEPYAQKRSSSAPTSSAQRPARGIAHGPAPRRAERDRVDRAGDDGAASVDSARPAPARSRAARARAATPGTPGKPRSSEPCRTAKRRPSSGETSSSG